MRVDKLGEDEMGSRRSGSTPGESTHKFVLERIVPPLWSEQSRSKF